METLPAIVVILILISIALLLAAFVSLNHETALLEERLARAERDLDRAYKALYDLARLDLNARAAFSVASELIQRHEKQIQKLSATTQLEEV